MKLNTVKQWKADILGQWMGRVPQNRVLPRTLSNELLRLGSKKANRITVGYSKYESEFFLELRIYSQSKKVVQLVHNIREAVGGEANIQLLENLVMQCPRSTEDLAKKCRPLAMGASVGHSHGGAGTITGFVDKDGSAGVLSCSHVLAPLNHRAVTAGDHIFQPGPRWTGSAKGADEIGVLDNWTVLRSGNAVNESDSAVAILNDNIGIHTPQGAKPGNYVPFSPDNLEYAGEQISGLRRRS